MEAEARRFMQRADEQAGPARTPQAFNGKAVGAMEVTRSLLWPLDGSGTTYEVPPVSVGAGAALYELQLRLAQRHGERVRRMKDSGGELTGEALEAELDANRTERDLALEAVELFGTLVKPRGRLRRLWWRIRRPNPFRSATPGEVAYLLGFFSTRQAGSSPAGASSPSVFQVSRRG